MGSSTVKLISLIKSYDPQKILKWNEALGAAIDDKMPPLAEAKIYAMVMLAMHDALNNIIPKYETYALKHTHENSMGLDKMNLTDIADASVSQAAHDVLIALYPASTNVADNTLFLCLDAIEDSEFKTRGIEIGMNAALAVKTKRQSDPPIRFTVYSNGTEPGIHQANYMPFTVANPPVWPANAVYGANLGSFVPFGINSGNQFRPIPPYLINSPEYTEDYNEVKKLGCSNCPDRTSEQTEIGAFWIENTSSMMNRIARTLALKAKMKGWEIARLLALIQMTQIDANIASFEGKYYYNYWRPITAIWAGDADQNDDTSGDVNWVSAFDTPPTPDYPSTHATGGGAAAELFKLFFRTDHKSFTTTSPYYLPGVERSFTNFSQISQENALSRIYIGYHFRNAVLEGEKLGRKIGKYIFENRLRELPTLFNF